MPAPVKVASVSEIAPGTSKAVTVNGNEIALFNLDGTFYALDNACPHAGGPLAEGEIKGENVVCGWHGWQFSIKTGTMVLNPRARVSTYPVKVEGNDIYIEA